MRIQPTHNFDYFAHYKPYERDADIGFELLNNEIYIYDEYGSWVDKNLNYYNHDGEPSGFFDSQFNFYDMKANKVPGGYKGTPRNIKKKNDYRNYLLSDPTFSDNSKFTIELVNIPYEFSYNDLYLFFRGVEKQYLDCKF